MSETFEVQDHILTTQEILTDYVSLAGAAEILGASETSARRWIKEYDLAHSQDPIKTLGHTMNRGITKFYLRKDIHKLHELLNPDKKVTRITPTSTKPSEPVSEGGLEPSYRPPYDHLAMSDKDWQRLAAIVAEVGKPKLSIKLLFGTLLFGVLTTALILFFVYKWIQLDISENRAFRQEYRDSRLIEDVKVEQRNFFPQ